jgi:RNA polymerase sigma-70 factor (sigma-E family)
MPEDDFREFVHGRGPALSRTAFLLTGDHHLAQDLLQSALAMTYQHWDRVRSGNPEAYVRRALHNTYISWWRRHRGAEAPDGIDPVGPAVADGAEATVRRLAVLDALRTLAPKQRAVVVLRYYEDLTEAQAAEVLGVSVGTVKRLHFDALARLRTLAPDLADDPTPPTSGRAPELPAARATPRTGEEVQIP